MNHLARLRFLVACFATFLLALSASAQGPLTPPASPPSATMKTLQQIEPRTDLQAAVLPPGVTTDANYHLIINEPGSYYLSQNLLVTKTNGIHVVSDGVTLDLNGFTIRRASGSGGYALQVGTNGHRCTIKNGGIGANSSPGFSAGVLTGAGPRGGTLKDLTVFGCSEVGISVADGWRIEGCTAHGNSGSMAIRAGRGSTLVNCIAHTNTTDGISGGEGSTFVNCTSFKNTGIGISVGSGSTIVNSTARENTYWGIHALDGVTLANCTAQLNGGIGIEAGGDSTLTSCTAYQNSGAYGITAGAGSTLNNCTASDNLSSATISAGIRTSGYGTVLGCTAKGNRNSTSTASSQRGVGIYAGSKAIVKDCTATDNQGDGIRVIFGSHVISNTANGNGDGGFGSGVHATLHSNRIEGNDVSANSRGISVDSGGNLIIKNSARLNTSNYDIAADNRYGVILDLTATGSAAANGSSAPGTLSTTTNPWANFSY